MKRSLCGNPLLVGLMLAGLATPGKAIEVIEGVDYPNFSSFGMGSVSVGILDPGENSITGELAGDCVPDSCNNDPNEGDTQDSFRVSVPSGMKIAAFTVTTTHVIAPDGFSATASLRSPTVQEIIPTSFLVLDGTTGNLLVQEILEGEYSISVYGQDSEQTGFFTFEWTVAIELVDVSLLFGDGFESADTSHWSSTLGN